MPVKEREKVRMIVREKEALHQQKKRKRKESANQIQTKNGKRMKKEKEETTLN